MSEFSTPRASTKDVSLRIESWPTKAPFHITGYTFHESRVLRVAISQGGMTGYGEASGVYYLDETADAMLAQVQRIETELARGLDRQQLRESLPAGGARNAVDCALWDLEAKQSGKRAWELAGIQVAELVTVNTVGIGTPTAMADMAKQLDTPKIKVKLDGNEPLACIQAVCAARPDAEIVVDVNQGWTFDQLVELAPQFKALGIAMIEQPLPRGNDAELEDYQSPIKLCGDESCLDTGELAQAARRYQMINIKLDKTGGLTEALDLAHQARAKGLELMVGNMVGTSLAMAPGFVVGQLCQFVDLDGPTLLQQDRESTLGYQGGRVLVPKPELWG